MMSKIDISRINKKGGTQSRASVNLDVVSDYADAVKDGAQFPPVVVFFDGSEYWLADGFHRYEAFARAGASEIHADVRQGTRRDAILYSVGANAHHGLRRTNDDKRRAVMVLLNDAEWSKWSANQVAKQCGVSHTFVNGLKSSLETNSSEPRTYTTKHGGQATMNTANIGGGSKDDQKTKPQKSQAKTLDQSASQAVASKDYQETAVEEADPETAKLRREIGKMTTEAMIDEIIGLRADVAEHKATIKDLRDEVVALKSEIALYRQDNLGRALGNEKRRADAAEGRMREHQANAARLQRQANAQKAEIEKLRKADENRLIPL